MTPVKRQFDALKICPIGKFNKGARLSVRQEKSKDERGFLQEILQTGLII